MTEQQRMTIGQAIQRGVAHHNAGRLREAEATYCQILQAEPNQPDATYLLGILAHQAGKNDVAVNLIGKALAAKPDFAEGHFNLGVVLHVQGKLADAVASYQKALAIQPGYAEAHNNLGSVLQQQGRMDDAAACCRRSLAIKPDYAEAHFNLGVVLHEQGKLDDAVASYRQSLALQPKQAEVHYNLAQALQKQGNLDEAAVSFEKALAIRPNYFDAQVGLGICRQFQGQLGEARQAYAAAIGLNPKPGIAHVGLRRIGIEEKAIEETVLDAVEGPDGELLPPGVRTWNRPVEVALIERLYELPALTPEEQLKSGLTKDRYSSGIRQGSMNISESYSFLDQDEPVLRKVRDDIVAKVSSLLNADIFICDSFFNIYHAGSRVMPHNHTNSGVDAGLGFQRQKYSLTYYVAAGDKTAEEPGVLMFHRPDGSINPQDGDVVLFPSSAIHSAAYSGDTDRVMIGVNFYTI